MDIDGSFPGGNIVVENVTGSEVRLHQDLRDTTIDWFYWCFGVKGAAGRSLRFTFTRGRALGVRGPAISFDAGETWSWLGAEVVDGNSFSCAFPGAASEVRLSFGMPYQVSEWQRFVKNVAAEHPSVVQTPLCITPKARSVDYVVMQFERGAPKHRVAVTCRHHCCEMMASYVLEGLIEWVLCSNDAAWLRENTEFFVVPFVDKDGVEDGDQGKLRKPRDHWLDYEGESIFASTKSIRTKLPAWGGGRLRVALDLHCPHISGPHHEVIYLVGSADHRVAAEQRSFSGILETAAEGPLPFVSEEFLPFGKSWNTRNNYKDGKEFSRWAAEIAGVALATTIEIPYANANGAEVNQESARLFGADLGKALAEYLRSIG